MTQMPSAYGSTTNSENGGFCWPALASTKKADAAYQFIEMLRWRRRYRAAGGAFPADKAPPV